MSVPVEFVNDRGNKVEIKDTEARRLAGVAQTAAENAQSTANGANTLAQSAKDIADAASSAASTNTENINTLDGKVTALEGSVSDIEEDIETIKEDYISKEELQPYDILEDTDNLPLTFITNGESLIDYKIYGNDNSNHINEVINNLPITIPNAKAGTVEDWTIEGNNIPQVENITKELPITFPSNGDNITDYTIYGNDNPSQPEPEGVLPLSFTTAETVLRDWEIEGNNNIGKNIVSLANFVDVNKNNVVMAADKAAGLVSVYTTDTPSANTQATVVLFAAVTGNYLMSGIPSNAPNLNIQMYCWDSAASARAKAWDRTSDSITCNKNNTEVEVYLEAGKQYSINVQVLTSYGTQTTPVTVSPMVRLDGTSSDFEPYQVGVGQRTANLFNKNAKDTNNGYVAQSYIDVDGNIQTSSAWNVSEYIPISANTDYVYIWKLTNGTTQEPCLAIYDSTKTLIETKKYKNFDPNTIVTFTTPANAAFIRASWYNSYADQTMLTKGTTIPTVFIPSGYQIPLAVQGKNLLEITTGTFTDHGVTFTFNTETGIVVANGKATGGQGRYAFYIEPTETLNLYLSGCPEGGSASTYNIYPWDSTAGARPKKWDGTTSQTESDYGNGNLEVQVLAGHKVSATIRIAEGHTADNLVFKPMYCLSNTSTNFVPYFHKDYTFYIGDTPLTEGESISKTSTGVNIETQVGENTVSTTLYNKPEMYCGMALGVGEPTKNLLDITAETQTINGVTFTVDKETGTITANGNPITTGQTILLELDAIDFLAGSYILSGCPSGGGAASYRLDIRPEGGGSIYNNIVDVGSGNNFTLSEDITLYVYVRLWSSATFDNIVFSPMVRLSNASADFEPFGYKVPITITDGNSNTVERTIYTGNSRLLEGQSITKTQAGIDIPTISGNNIISTTLYNKPEMNVVCNSNVLGVGQKTNDGYILPITVIGENLFDISKSGMIYIDTTNQRYGNSLGKLQAGTYTLSFTRSSQQNLYVTKRTGNTYSQGSAISSSPYTFDIAANVDEVIVRTTASSSTTWETMGFANIMVTHGSTAPTTYSAYTETPYTFQLGSQPLAQGQSISKTSTGTDIALLSGTNIISTSLNNKPNMFISYQSGELGVGVRTANLIELSGYDAASSGVTISEIVDNTGTIKASCTAQQNRSIRWNYSFENGKSYTISLTNNTANGTGRVAIRNSNGSTIITSQRLNTTGTISFVYTHDATAYPDGAYFSILINSSTATEESIDISALSMVESSTAPENFIPYGYEIPIRIYDGEANAENTNYTDLNFYIGNSLLSADEYIDFINNKIYKYISSVLTPTNPIVDLPVIPTNGTNTIDTSISLYNKPTMYIKYSTDSFSRIFTTTLPTTFINHSDKVKDWIIYGNENGVGEEGDDGYIIPLVVNGNTINIPIGDAALTEGETVSKTSTNIDIPTVDGENTINTTLTNKPTMKITKDFVTKEYIEDVANSCMNDNVEDIVENVVDDKVDKQMFFMFYSSINKNGMFRGKDLTNVYTVDEIYQKVSSGDFDDLYLGDYFTKSITTDIYTKFTGSEFASGTTYYTRTGTLNNWVYAETEDTSYDSSKTYYTKTTKTENVSLMIAHFNYYYNIGDTALTNPHIILTNRNYGFATTSKMNPTNTTVGGYYNSEMHQTTLPCYAKSLKTALNNHLLSHKTLLSNAINASTPSMAGAGLTGASSGWAWVDTELQLMTEQQLFGSDIWTSSAYDVGCDGEKLAVFNFVNGVQNGRSPFWLRSVASSTYFARCSNGGSASYNYASYAYYVRPLIVFG